VETGHGRIKRLARSLGDLGREAKAFGCTLGSGSRGTDKLVIVGTPTYEPWHFTAHLADEARRQGRGDLSPILLRWQIAPGSPAHLSRSADEVARASRNTTVLVIPDGEDPELLERVMDAHRRGARVMTIERAGSNLAICSHELLTVGAERSDQDYDACQHVVSSIAPGR
jgi:hypothetical protein